MDKVESICLIPIPLDDQTKDSMGWVGNNTCTFSVRSAYEAVVGAHNEGKNWLITKGRLLTNLE